MPVFRRTGSGSQNAPRLFSKCMQARLQRRFLRFSRIFFAAPLCRARQETSFPMLDHTALRTILQNARRIAVLGAKDKPGQPVDTVGRYLLHQGYIVYPVHPARKTVWGLAAFPDLAALPEPVDVIDVFRAPPHCPGHAREIPALPWRPKLFWMQLGISSPEVSEILAGTGVEIVENACLMVEHARLLGNAQQH